ncbi:rho GTPase-activating protein 45 [Ixodes scapularis]
MDQFAKVLGEGTQRNRHAKSSSTSSIFASSTLQPEERGSSSPSVAAAASGESGSSPLSRQHQHSRSGSGASSASGMAPGGGGAGAATATQSATSLASSASSGSAAGDGGRSAVATSGPGVVQREDILVLTHDVRAFKEALGRLRKVFGAEGQDKQRRETRLVAAHERLGQVLRILRSILEKYPPIQSTELLVAAGTLIQHVKGHDYSEDKASQSESFFEAVDQLALAFSSRVSEYLMGDLDLGTSAMGKTRSCENLLSPDRTTGHTYSSSALTGQEVDAKLMRLSEGVEFSLRRAKIWSKYAKDVMTYVEKRANLEADHARNLLKLAQTMRPILKEESFLPFQSIYCTAIDQDLDNSSNCLSNCTLLHDHKFIEPLTARRNEHEKARKQLKEIWHRELKRMQELETNVRKARALYVQRQQDHEKAKESAHRAAEAQEGGDGGSSRCERKRRLEDDALQKAREAETTYKACVVEANERLLSLERTKMEVLQQVRELMCQCDQTMKAVTVAYFQLQHTVSAPAPVQFQTLCESSRMYEPGSQYMEFVRRIPLGRPTEPQLLTFEPYTTDTRTESRRIHEAVVANDEPLDGAALDARLGLEAGAGAKAAGRTWGTCPGSDSDSVGSCHSNKSPDTSPAASPQAPARTLLTVSSGDELDTDHDNDSGLGLCRRMCLSRAAETHSFRKLRTPSRCRECDSYVYFQGVECSECGLSSHKKCLETLAIRCGHKRLPRKMTTFGVDLTDHTDEADADIPYIVRKCVEEIDRRGYDVKGLYRVSGVKSKVEKLCQCFENGAQLVDLSDAHPNVVANVLKLYLRQLPEPLLTFRLYPHFVGVAREHPAGSHAEGAVPEEDQANDAPPEEVVGGQEAVPDLRRLVEQLPSVHRRTLALLLRHLARVAQHARKNCMPASNLAIMFGPTLLRTREGSASLSSLVDTVHQTRAIELLITYVDRIFEDPDANEQYTVLEAITRPPPQEDSPEVAEEDPNPPLSRAASATSQASDEGQRGADLESHTCGTLGDWPAAEGGSEDGESDASDDGRASVSPLAPTQDRRSPDDAHEEDPSGEDPAGDCPPVPPPRRAAGTSSLRSKRLENQARGGQGGGQGGGQDGGVTWSAISKLASHKRQHQQNQHQRLSRPTNVAELRRQFFEAPWGSASLEEFSAGSLPHSPAMQRLLSSTRTSSEPHLAAHQDAPSSGPSSLQDRDSKESSGTFGRPNFRESGPHRVWPHGPGDAAPRRTHTPLRESVSLKHHWYSTDEASSEQETTTCSSSWGLTRTQLPSASDRSGAQCPSPSMGRAPRFV